MDEKGDGVVEVKEAGAEVLDGAKGSPSPVPVLVHMQERCPVNVEADKARKAWLKARAELQLPSIPKDARGHGYDYASLSEVLSLVDRPVREAGFVIRWTVWTPSAALVGVRCTLTHVEGWYERSEIIGSPEKLVGGRMNGIQQRGAFVTYAERYTLLSVLGICADFDSDGADPARGST